MRFRIKLAALALAALLPLGVARAEDGGVDGGGDPPDMEEGIQPSTTPSRFACRVDGAPVGAGLALLLPVGVALYGVRRRRRP